VRADCQGFEESPNAGIIRATLGLAIQAILLDMCLMGFTSPVQELPYQACPSLLPHAAARRSGPVAMPR